MKREDSLQHLLEWIQDYPNQSEQICKSIVEAKIQSVLTINSMSDDLYRRATRNL